MAGEQHPAITEAREVIALEQAARDAQEFDELSRLWRAVMLSPSIEILEALLRGEHVPLNRLDQAWVKRYGLRDSA